MMDKYERRRLRLLWIKDHFCGKSVATLAKRLEKSDTYVHRMLYPEGKDGKKRIGEDSVDLVLDKFGIDLDATGADDERVPMRLTQTEMFYQWVSADESRLISDFRTTNENGRQLILDTAGAVEKIILPASSENKG